MSMSQDRLDRVDATLEKITAMMLEVAQRQDHLEDDQRDLRNSLERTAIIVAQLGVSVDRLVTTVDRLGFRIDQLTAVVAQHEDRLRGGEGR